MSTKFDVPGLPDGTITIPQPATCPELAELYSAPLCAFPHDLHLIPMQIDLIPALGGEVLWWLLIAAGVLIGGGLIAFGLAGGAERTRRRAEKP